MSKKKKKKGIRENTTYIDGLILVVQFLQQVEAANLCIQEAILGIFISVLDGKVSKTKAVSTEGRIGRGTPNSL